MFIELIGSKCLYAVRHFRLLTHAHPNVCIQHVRLGCGFLWRLGENDLPALELRPNSLTQSVFGGSSDPELESEMFGGPSPRSGNIAISVAHKTHFDIL